MTRNGAMLLLALLLAAGVLLLAVELGAGAAGYGSGTVASPCAKRPPFRGGGIDGIVQQVVLDGLDGAACSLATTREELVLSLAPGSGITLGARRPAVEAAVRAGMLHSLNAAVDRGEVPALLAPALRKLVERVPVAQLIEGGVDLSELLG